MGANIEAVEYKSVNQNRCTICAENFQGSPLSKRVLAQNGKDSFDEEKVCDVISISCQERGQSSVSSPFPGHVRGSKAGFGEEGGILEGRGTRGGHVLLACHCIIT